MRALEPDDLPSVEEALARVLAAATELAAAHGVDAVETVPAAEAVGRVLAEPHVCPRDLPAADLAAMDGFAVRAEDVRGASEAAPVRLRVVARILAGESARGGLSPGEAVRIMTGAPLPQGADAVVPFEHTSEDGDGVRIERSPGAQPFVRRRGEDFGAAETLGRVGERLGPLHVAALIGAGAATLRVARRPRLAVIATGSELLPPGAAYREGCVYESNRLVVRSLTGSVAETIDLGICPDDLAETRRRLEEAMLAADVVVTSGGASVGDKDLLRPALAELGVQTLVDRVALKPGKPLYVGRFARGERTGLVFGLPGNPGAVLVTLTLFVVPALRVLGRCAAARPVSRKARLSAPVKAPGPRETYLVGRLAVGAEGLQFMPGDRQGSGSLRGSMEADALARLPRNGAALQPGDPVEVLPLAPDT